MGCGGSNTREKACLQCGKESCNCTRLKNGYELGQEKTMNTNNQIPVNKQINTTNNAATANIHIPPNNGNLMPIIILEDNHVHPLDDI
jgi:hypothetical protein